MVKSPVFHQSRFDGVIHIPPGYQILFDLLTIFMTGGAD